MLNRQQLEQLSQQSITGLDEQELIDITNISLRKDLSAQDKVSDFIEQIKTPYCFLCGETPVRVCFANEGYKLGELLESYFIGLKQQ